MHISVAWLNSLLAPASPVLLADEIENALMNLGFPSEGREVSPSGDVVLDVEVTSNRGDVLSHVGMANEIAAKYERVIVLPHVPAAAVSDQPSNLTVENYVPGDCPRFTSRVIRGVKVGPSPAWLRERLESVGQRSISNVVDITNYISLELGNPCHVFDLNKLAGNKLIVRNAYDKERLTTLDGKVRVLAEDQIVVADEQRAQSLAGVMGGADSQVSSETTDVVLEMATWEPAAVRRAARAHQLRTDASYRFERTVDARTIDAAAERAADLIVQVAGGARCGRAIDVGQPQARAAGAGSQDIINAESGRLMITLRPARCNQILGDELTLAEMVLLLERLRIRCSPSPDGGILAAVPFDRRDLTREIDLIEEIARLRGLDQIEVLDAIPVRIRPPQNNQVARREMAATLTGLGFYETVTFSFISPQAAAAFVPAGLQLIQVSAERRKSEPVCRPSVIPGLLACRRTNQHGGVKVAGGIRLFETSAVFAQDSAGVSIERQNLALLLDIVFEGKRAATSDLQRGVKLLRGAIEATVRTLAGSGAVVACRDAKPHCQGLSELGYAEVTLDGYRVGYLGMVNDEQLKMYDLGGPVAVAELGLAELLAPFPPRATVSVPPQFPGIERDLSLIVDEQTTWDAISAQLYSSPNPRLEKAVFLGCFRGEQIGKGKKSVTVRLSFRDEERTLRHDEIDSPVQAMTEAMKRTLGATLRV